jgi:hypothetical protein
MIHWVAEKVKLALAAPRNHFDLPRWSGGTISNFNSAADNLFRLSTISE